MDMVVTNRRRYDDLDRRTLYAGVMREYSLGDEARRTALLGFLSHVVGIESDRSAFVEIDRFLSANSGTYSNSSQRFVWLKRHASASGSRPRDDTYIRQQLDAHR
jgi:hypothetical protein